MIYKEVKEYSKRQRINLNKDDNFTPGDEVVIFKRSEFDNYKQNILNLQNQLRDTENKLYYLQEQTENQEQNLKEIITNVTTPIYENHKEQLKNKDKEIKQLQLQLKVLERKINQYNLDMQGLNTIDIAIFRKHKKLIQNFNEEITAIANDPKIIETSKAIPGNDADQD